MDLPEYRYVETCLKTVPIVNCPVCAAELEIDATFCGACGFRMRARRGSLVGMTIAGKYRIEARIAAGGFGAIYRATQLSTGRIVALKVLHSDLASDASLSARFRREGATLSSLRSPHTVTTLDVGEADDGTMYIAMELLVGESLHDRFRSLGTLAWRDVVAVLRGVCASLVEAHALGIVHRDLKPANIHLEPAPRIDHVKVIDFGIAKLITGSVSDDGSDLTRVGTAVGTLDYMSPEQLVGTPADGRSDIYTLGVVAYEMITGQRPFADATGPTSLITALFTRTPVPPSALADVPVGLDFVLLRCLERDVANRYPTVQALDAALVELLAAHPERRTTLVQSLAEANGANAFPVEEATIQNRPLQVQDTAPARIAEMPAPADSAGRSEDGASDRAAPGSLYGGRRFAPPADEATVVDAIVAFPSEPASIRREQRSERRQTRVGRSVRNTPRRIEQVDPLRATLPDKPGLTPTGNESAQPTPSRGIAQPRLTPTGNEPARPTPSRGLAQPRLTPTGNESARPTPRPLAASATTDTDPDRRDRRSRRLAERARTLRDRADWSGESTPPVDEQPAPTPPEAAAPAWPANLTHVWPPVLPPAAPRAMPNATPFEIADGSTVGPAPRGSAPEDASYGRRFAPGGAFAEGSRTSEPAWGSHHDASASRSVHAHPSASRSGAYDPNASLAWAEASSAGPAPDHVSALGALPAWAQPEPRHGQLTGAQPLARFNMSPSQPPMNPSYLSMSLATGTRLEPKTSSARIALLILALLLIGGGLGAALAFL